MRTYRPYHAELAVASVKPTSGLPVIRQLDLFLVNTARLIVTEGDRGGSRDESSTCLSRSVEIEACPISSERLLVRPRSVGEASAARIAGGMELLK